MDYSFSVVHSLDTVPHHITHSASLFFLLRRFDNASNCVRMKLLEDFNLEPESESDNDSVDSSRTALSMTTVTSVTAALDRRPLSSFQETEVSNRIKMEVDEYDEYTELGRLADKNADLAKPEPSDDGHYGNEEPRLHFDSLAASEMCRVYETLAEVKPPPGIVPLTASEPRDEAEHRFRLRWRMLPPVCRHVFLHCSVILRVSNKGLRCQNVTVPCRISRYLRMCIGGRFAIFQLFTCKIEKDSDRSASSW